MAVRPVPPEIVQHILAWCSVFTLMCAAHASRGFRTCAQAVLRTRFRGALSPWVASVPFVQTTLIDNSAVIGGSWAVAFLMVDTARRLQPRSLDIFCPDCAFDNIVHHFTGLEQYTVMAHAGSAVDVWIEDPNVPEEEFSLWGVGQWARLVRGTQIVNIAASDTQSPFLPLALSWSTLVMTAVTPVSVHCAYPALTKDGVYLYDTPSDSEAEAYMAMVISEKNHHYDLHGFDGVDNRKRLSLPHQRRTAMKDIRSFGDVDSLKFQFGEDLEELEHDIAETQVIWRMGGRSVHAGPHASELQWMARCAGHREVWKKSL